MIGTDVHENPHERPTGTNKFLHPGGVLISTAPQQTRQRVGSIWVFIVIFCSRLFICSLRLMEQVFHLCHSSWGSQHTHSPFQEWTIGSENSTWISNFLFILHVAYKVVSLFLCTIIAMCSIWWVRDRNTILYGEQHQFQCWTNYIP